MSGTAADPPLPRTRKERGFERSIVDEVYREADIEVRGSKESREKREENRLKEKQGGRSRIRNSEESTGPARNDDSEAKESTSMYWQQHGTHKRFKRSIFSPSVPSTTTLPSSFPRTPSFLPFQSSSSRYHISRVYF